MRTNIGIGLGNTSIIVLNEKRRKAIRETSVMAVDKQTHYILKIGNDAKNMLRRLPGNITRVHPSWRELMAKYDVTLKFVKYYMDLTYKKKLFKPNLIIAVPVYITEDEEQALLMAANELGAKNVYLIPESVAAAVGAGVDVYSPSINMIMDVGGGKTELAVTSTGNIISFQISKISGKTFDDAIIKYVRGRYNVNILDEAAEQIKIELGDLSSGADGDAVVKSKKVSGTDIVTGLPKTLILTSAELAEPLRNEAGLLIDELKTYFEKLPEEIIADIRGNGICLVGGGSMLTGFSDYISDNTGIAVNKSENPINCVVTGIGDAFLRIRGMEKTEHNIVAVRNQF